MTTRRNVSRLIVTGQLVEGALVVAVGGWFVFGLWAIALLPLS